MLPLASIPFRVDMALVAESISVSIFIKYFSEWTYGNNKSHIYTPKKNHSQNDNVERKKMQGTSVCNIKTYTESGNKFLSSKQTSKKYKEN